jgi:citrate synthase
MLLLIVINLDQQNQYMVDMGTWLTRDEALDRLGVRAQTLYAYVSRNQVGMQPDPADPRRSLYRSEDIEALTMRRARGRGDR